MKKTVLTMAMLMIMLVLAACSDSTPEDTNASAEGSEADQTDTVETDREHWPEKLRFADTGVEGMEQLQREHGPFKDAMEEVLGIEVEFFSVTDRTAAAVAAQFDQVDIVLTGPSEYVVMKSKAEVEPVIGLTRPGYRLAFIARADSGIESLEDMKGKKVAMKDVGSTSGHIGPSSILIENGFNLDQDFDGSIALLGDARIEALRGGDVDVVGTGADDYYELANEEGEDEWTLVHEGPDLPSDLFVASPTLDKEFVEEVKQLFLENQDYLLAELLQTEENDKYSDSELIDAKDEDYDSIREAYDTLGLTLE
ncbi:phosphate/phosphite/phosphonate ABC transporter substrate-binding protein [Jeotgalibacillus sp. ET6]|uniref:phosphate/phosphite/phosphonate ABC transporter substrate-binding protein n=1 Tax=Jeotgalibacillus sp. ET6 TaxID=3037260 RepID=UPI0024184C47|nr:phosphate/phosphite/phosphonate ABC transporter substrate-binding protein [Jeotgalibacillus sp. ET6]MDG5472557.1 phosphate/phosphite/phosphonate ABC transporter substrate-binding protein [Jeotgalibacillus sp. ET6]